MSSPADPTETPSSGLRKLVFSSLMTGLCPLIPVPLADDWARDVLRRRLVADLLREGDADLGTPAVECLAQGRGALSVEGCLKGCVLTGMKLVFKIFKKIFRKILIFLTIKDCADTFAETFHEAYLVRHAVARGDLDSAAGMDRVERVREAMEATIRQIDHRPIERIARHTLSGSGRLLRRAARHLGKTLKKLRGRERSEELDAELPLDDEERELGGLVDELTALLGRQTDYLRRLEDVFDERMTSP